MKNLDVITTLHTHNRTFKIVLDDNKYCAIEDKYITDGKINQELRGYQVHPADTLDGCIEQVNKDCTVDEYKEQGYSHFVAIELAYGHSLEDALKAEKQFLKMMAGFKQKAN